MIIEDGIHDPVMRALNLGSYPRAVAADNSWAHSPQPFDRMVYCDYHVSRLIATEFHGDELPDDSHVSAEAKQTLLDLFSVLDNVSSSTMEYEERLYYSVIRAHMCFLDGRMDEMKQVLTSITVVRQGAAAPTSASVHHLQFVSYVTVRYYVLLGLTNWKYWLDYLTSFAESFTKTQVAANHWLRNLYYELGSTLASNGQLTWGDISELSFAKNELSVTGFCSYLILHTKLSDTKFIEQFMAWLDQSILAKINDPRHRFPDAAQSTPEIEAFVTQLYESVESFHRIASTAPVRTRQRLLKPSTSHQFLLAQLSRTYQSKQVTANLIYTLISIDENDEALAAFETIIQYLKLDEAHSHGNIDDVLSVINLYSTCLLKLNPKNGARFLYSDDTSVLHKLKQAEKKLQEYLDKFCEYAEISVTGDDDDLGFLYKKYNPNLTGVDRSTLVDVVSQGYYALGQFEDVTASRLSPTLEQMGTASDQALNQYRRAVIINTTGNPHYLYTYSRCLATMGRLKPALKLCKFTLKKYPETFNTWNLMVLILSAFETNRHGQGVVTSQTESEKFIENALNIASLYNQKNRGRVSLETRYEILQLKLTQLAVLEQNHGVNYILEHMTDLFVLYQELFETTPSAQPSGKVVSSVHDSTWSHRPSVIDPASKKDTHADEITPHANGHVVKISGQHSHSTSRRHSLSLDRFRRSSKHAKPTSAPAPAVPTTTAAAAAAASVSRQASVKRPQTSQERTEVTERKILQELWLWTSRVYMRVGLADEAEQCLVEAESIYEPNVRTYTALGYLTSESRKFLALQEFERSLEIMTTTGSPLSDYGLTLLGLAKLFILDDRPESSLFISAEDRKAGLIRLKALLEEYAATWGYGYTTPEVWYFLSKIYEVVDDKVLLKKSLWRCIELEDYRPVRAFNTLEGFRTL
ncbi:hypothetical protein DIURU_000054 [Diutina rugosa]|uniref:Cargo-transport protein YPP1 n=1 Tax=Diutina rugosa TaxID=5481 RepID=A0A642UZN9_DIURU|nr:uncharacterized protein DIURU_000054 [Diutina rugosa]KAA8908741.1 hypothetical protein DIURU_000054 [Diutina rugosa]